MIALTEKQASILRWFLAYTFERMYQPSMREIGAEFGIKSTNGVNDHLMAIARKGYIEFGDRIRSRAIEIKPKALEWWSEGVMGR
jgi:repressor LexA